MRWTWSVSSRLALGLLVLGLTAAPTVGCADLDQDDVAPAELGVESGPAPEVLPHWEALLAARPGPLAVSWSASAGTPRSLYGVLSAGPSSAAALPTEASARAFLAAHAPLLRATPTLDDLAAAAHFDSPLGAHFVFPQVHKGVRVHGAEVKVHYDRQGRIVALNNSYAPGVRLASVTPSLAREEALAAARAAVSGEEGVIEQENAELVVHVARGATRLAYRITLSGLGPSWEVFVDAHTGELAAPPADENRYATGTGRIFKVNAIVATQSNALLDGNDAASAVPASAYSTVTLQGLTGNGYLDGQYASSSDSQSRAYSASLSFFYDRSQTGFSEVMGYHFIDLAERHIQSLGFTNINNRQQVFAVNRYKKDNSYYTPGTKKISFGTGGVDDAEDAEVVLHEYGHSIQDNQVPGFGSGLEAGSMGEGFGDYWAGTVGAQLSGGFQDACVAEWDAVSYSSTNPPCLRRLDEEKHYPEDMAGEVHADGELWSATLWQIRGAIGAAKADKVVLQAHFLVSADASFNEAANALVTAAQGLGYTSTEVNAIRSLLQARGFTVSI